jgi:hypothetical protein
MVKLCDATERGFIRDVDGQPITPGRYMLVRDGVDSLMVDVAEDETTSELIVTVDNLPLEPQRYRLAELLTDIEMRRLPDDYPRDGADLDL